MPRKGRGSSKPKQETISKCIKEYFPPSPPSDNNNYEHGLQITSETVYYNGPSEEERLEAKSVYSITECLPTPDDSPEKVEEAEVKVESIDIHNNISACGESASSQSGNYLRNDIGNTQTKTQLPSKKPKAKRSGHQNKIKVEEVKNNHFITEFFPVRKSSRKTAKELQREQEFTIKRKLLEGCEDGLKITHYEGKGRGIETTRSFSRGDFIVEYAGELVELKEAKCREEIYKKDTSYGCYMYFFNHKGKSYCVDATAETGKLGRLLNHSRTKPNCITKTIDIEEQPFLVLIAARDIEPGEELVYDYGERSKEAILDNPWLRE